MPQRCCSTGRYLSQLWVPLEATVPGKQREKGPGFITQTHVCFSSLTSPSACASFLWKLRPLQNTKPKRNRSSTSCNQRQAGWSTASPNPVSSQNPAKPGSLTYWVTPWGGIPTNASGPRTPARGTRSSAWRAWRWERTSEKRGDGEGALGKARWSYLNQKFKLLISVLTQHGSFKTKRNKSVDLSSLHSQNLLF